MLSAFLLIGMIVKFFLLFVCSFIGFADVTLVSPINNQQVDTDVVQFNFESDVEKGFYLFAQLRSDDKFYNDEILVVISDKDSIETEYRKEYKVCTHPTNATEFQLVQSVTDRAPGSFEEFCSAKGNDIDPAQNYSFYIADCNENCVEVSWFSFNKKLKSPSEDDFKKMSDQVIGAFRDGFYKKQSSLEFTAQYIAE